MSLLPDLVLGAGKRQAHTTWEGVAALMLMHLAVAVAACAVTACRLQIPLPPAIRRQREQAGKAATR